eukprot:s1282_g2.t1
MLVVSRFTTDEIGRWKMRDMGGVPLVVVAADAFEEAKTWGLPSSYGHFDREYDDTPLLLGATAALRSVAAMVRAEVFLNGPPSMDQEELPTSQILPVMLVASLSLVLLRAAVLIYHLVTETDDTGEASGKSIPRGVPFFVGALATRIDLRPR